jgi:hypothetical protein
MIHFLIFWNVSQIISADVRILVLNLTAISIRPCNNLKNTGRKTGGKVMNRRIRMRVDG